MRIDAKSIENLVVISNICDYGVEKKGFVVKKHKHIFENASFHSI
jgi:hypothetical protein